MYISGNDVTFKTLSGDEIRLDIRDISRVEPTTGWNGFAISINTRSREHYMAKGSESDYRRLDEKVWDLK